MLAYHLLVVSVFSRQGYGGGPCPNDDVWYLDVTNNRWRDLPRCATPRVWSQMVPLSNDPGKAILYGGSTTVFGPQVFAVSSHINFIPITLSVEHAFSELKFRYQFWLVGHSRNLIRRVIHVCAEIARS